ncbi:MAG: hypothetical protein HOY79_43090 [Streptomyces sp.]|nr:hypothetical protein [Streptomyces sp.]
MSQFPALLAGQRMTAAVAAQMLPYWAQKIGPTGRASTTTLADDPDLILALPGAGTFTFELFLNYTGGTLGSSDLKMAMVYSGSSSYGVWAVNGVNTTSTAQVNMGGNGTGTAGTITVGTSGGTFLTVDIKGELVATSAGNLSLQWAQNTSNATATNLRQGCWMRVTQIA